MHHASEEAQAQPAAARPSPLERCRGVFGAIEQVAPARLGHERGQLALVVNAAPAVLLAELEQGNLLVLDARV